MTKRIKPDAEASAEKIVEQLLLYTENAPQHSWSRGWMKIAADFIKKGLENDDS